jgi:hypothetical protein
LEAVLNRGRQGRPNSRSSYVQVAIDALSINC